MQKSVLHECQKLSTFDQDGREFVMQDRHDRDLTVDSVSHARSRIPDLKAHGKPA